MKAIEDRIRELLRQRMRVQPGADEPFTIRNLTEILQAQEAASRVLTLLLGAVAVGEPAGRRHRDHEHHAGQRHRAHARDRAAHGGRRARPRHPQAVPRRGDHAVDDRRRARHPARRDRVVCGRRVRRLAHRHHAAGDLPRGRLRRRRSASSSASIRHARRRACCRSKPCATSKAARATARPTVAPVRGLERSAGNMPPLRCRTESA